MKDLPKNIKVKIGGIMYKLPSTVVKKQEHSVVTTISLGSKNIALLLRQYLKIKFPQYKGYVNSEQYAGGSSIRLYVTQKDGGKISTEDFDVIEKFAKSFKSGSFDGMTDSYNYENNTKYTSLGNEVESYVSYVFCYNSPREGTFEWGLNEVVNKGKDLSEVMWGFSPSVKKRLIKYLVEQPYISQQC